MNKSKEPIEYRIIIIDDVPGIHEDFRGILLPVVDTGQLDLMARDLLGIEVKPSLKRSFVLEHSMQGEDGVEKIRQSVYQQRPFALAFVDMRMPPGWDGLTTIEQIWEIDPNIHIVICTAYSDHSMDTIIERLGLTDKLLILKKPFNSVEVEQIANAMTVKWELARKLGNTILRLEEEVIEKSFKLEAITVSQIELQGILDNLPISCFVTDRKLHITYWNPASKQIFGYSFREIVGRTPLDTIVAEEFKVSMEAHFQKLIKEKHKLLATTINRVKSGEVILCEWISTPLVDDHGNLQGVLVLCRDITEQRRAEEALLQSKANLSNFYESAEMMMGLVEVLENDFVHVYDNSAAIEFAGLSPKKLKGKLASDYMNLKQLKFMLSHFNQSVRTRRPVRFERKIKHKGQELWIFASLSFIRNLSNGSKLCSYIIHDITERKNAEKSVERVRSYLDDIINSMPSVLIGIDRNDRINHWNLEAVRMTEIPVEQAIGAVLDEVLLLPRCELDNIRTVMATGSPRKDEKVQWNLNGNHLYIDVTIYPLINDELENDIEGVVVRIDDITEHVHLEEMMIQSEKMLSVGGLAAGMAHEINNPLAGILQSTQVINHRLMGDLRANHRVAKQCGISTEGLRKYIEQRGVATLIDNVMESGERAANIVENMLSFSRKSDSQFGLQNLADLLEKALELASNDYDLKKKYDFRQIEIIRHYASGTPQVYCEGNKIQQVFLNILKNGAYSMYTKAGKSVFQLRLFQEGDMVKVEIEDNGEGINDDVRRRIFEPFYTTKDVGIGTGLGLYVSYFIITENHSGKIFVESVFGEGSTFVICLPLRPE